MSRPHSSAAADVDREGAAGRFALARRFESAAVPALVSVTVFLLAADQGGYFPRAWGWGAVAMLLPLGVWLALGRRTEAGWPDAVLIGAFAVFALWTALSVAWSDSATQTVWAAERAVVYLAALAMLLVLGRRRSLGAMIGGLLAAIVAIACYSLSTRLFPDRLGVFDPIAGYRLSEPVGYWNALGIFAAIGVFLAVGFAARGRVTWLRLLSAATLAVLLPTLYFTFSRGAWLALALGLVCAVAYDARRLQLLSVLLFVAPAPVIATVVAARSDALTHTDAPLAAAVREGHRLGLVLLVLVPATALCCGVVVYLERRLRAPRAARLVYAAAWITVAAVALVAVLVHFGGPRDAVTRAYDSFTSPPAGSANLNERLLSLTSNGRLDLWDVALDVYDEHRVLGSGAGTFARHWFRERPAPFNAQDAHSVYAETLAELGPLGLLLLAAAVFLPLAAAGRARRHPLSALLVGAYVAFLVHAGFDWDFELTGVTLGALFCGAALVIAGRKKVGERAVPPRVRTGALALIAALFVFALWALIANSALSASREAIDAREWVTAEAEARKAHRLMPWSPEPWEALGFAQAGRGDLRAAGASFHRALAEDPGDWTLWLDLASVTRGDERRAAIARARQLNPLSPELDELRLRSQ